MAMPDINAILILNDSKDLRPPAAPVNQTRHEAMAQGCAIRRGAFGRRMRGSVTHDESPIQKRSLELRCTR